jgi:hypothetical protein
LIANLATKKLNEMTENDLCTYIEAAAMRMPVVPHIHIDDGVRLTLEDGKEVVAVLLPHHGLVRLYADCATRAEHEDTELTDDDEWFVVEEEEGETVELGTDHHGQWSIYCAEDEAAFTLVLDLPATSLDQAQCDEILDRFIGELAFWTEALSRSARPAPNAGPYCSGTYPQAALN